MNRPFFWRFIFPALVPLSYSVAVPAVPAVHAVSVEPSHPSPAPSYIITPASDYWLKKYDLSPVKETWSLEVRVKNFQQDLPRVEEAFAKGGAVTTQARELFIGSAVERSQQLSYRLSRAGMKKVRDALKKLSTGPEPIIRRPLEPVPLAEVKAKIDKLDALKRGRAADLAALAPMDAVLDELLAHLVLVKAIQERTDSEVQVNLTVREAR